MVLDITVKTHGVQLVKFEKPSPSFHVGVMIDIPFSMAENEAFAKGSSSDISLYLHRVPRQRKSHQHHQQWLDAYLK